MTLPLPPGPAGRSSPLPTSTNPRDWQLYGTVPIDGTTGFLARKPGSYAIVVGTVLRELALWERIDVSNTVAIKKPPGHEVAQGWGSVFMRSVG